MSAEQRQDFAFDQTLEPMCDRFETAWRAGLQPRIEDYIAEADKPVRSQLLRELVNLELAYRRQQGDRPSRAEYERRFSSDSAAIRAAFDSHDAGLARLSAAGPKQTRQASVGGTPPRCLDVRCPNCHEATQVAVDTSLTVLTCQCCGSSFSLVAELPTLHAPRLSQLGRFELIERLGVGGFGTVWKARDKELDRTVAIKIPRQELINSLDQERFFHEARAAAQLNHPNIVSVYEVGRDGSSMYIVSDYIRGVTLDDWLSGQRVTCREAAELCGKVAAALHHAHEAGVVHRDLKPANILLDAAGEPHLTDFGLARRDVGELTMTLEGQVLGTPAYMSPEQAAGRAHQANRCSDIYSLGVVLFQLVTGELPFRGNCRMVMHQVLNEEPPSPRNLNATVPKDLETIILKCLEKAPAHRYQTAGEFAHELQRFLAGEPIQARAIGPLTKTIRWAKRKPTAATVALMVVGLAIVGPLIALHQYQLLNERNTALRAEEAARADAVELTDFALAMLETPSRMDFLHLTREPSVVELYQQSAERIGQQFATKPAVAARLWLALGKSLRDLGEYQIAAEFSRKAVSLSRSASGPDAVPTLMAERLSASCLNKQGQSVKAREMLLDLVARAESALGSDHPAYLLLCTDLAILYAENYQLQAIGWIEKAVLHYAKALPEDDPDYRFLVNRAGWVYCRLGRHDIGLKYFEDALALRRKYDGRLANSTLRAQHANVAWALTALGRHQEAIANQQEALALFREKYPDNPERWLWPQAFLVYRYCRAEQFDDAINAATDYLQNCRKSGEDPADHHDWAIWELHDTLYREGQKKRALALAQQVVDSLRHVFGDDDLTVHRATLRRLRTTALMGEVDEGQIERMVSHLRKRCRSQQLLLGDQHPDVAETAKVLASGLIMLPKPAADPSGELEDWYRAVGMKESDGAETLYLAAVASLAQGNREEHRRLCHDMLSRWSDTNNVEHAKHVSAACVVVPGSTPDHQEVVRLARASQQPRIISAALYRAQQYELALKTLNEVATEAYSHDAWVLAIRSMALHQLGRTAEAKQQLLDAHYYRSLHVPAWHEEVTAALLIQEADALLRSNGTG